MINQTKYSHGAFALIWIALGLVCLFAAFQQMNTDINYYNKFDTGVLIIASFAVLAILTGIAFFKAWPFSRIFNLISGLVIAFYSLAVLIMGVEDVGGPFIAIPFGLAGIALGMWSILIKRSKA